MNSQLLLVLAALCASAGPRASADPAAPPASRPPVDPAALSDRARAALEADPAGFRDEHAELLETHRRWSQDPSLGQAECAAAKEEPRSCMEGKVREMGEILNPASLAVVNSYVKLLPRGVSAAVPDSPGSEKPAPAAAARSGPAFSPSSAPSPVGISAASFRPGPASLQLSPVPSAASVAPPPPKPWWEQQLDYYRCLYAPARCSQ